MATPPAECVFSFCPDALLWPHIIGYNGIWEMYVPWLCPLITMLCAVLNLCSTVASHWNGLSMVTTQFERQLFVPQLYLGSRLCFSCYSLACQAHTHSTLKIFRQTCFLSYMFTVMFCHFLHIRCSW